MVTPGFTCMRIRPASSSTSRTTPVCPLLASTTVPASIVPDQEKPLVDPVCDRRWSRSRRSLPHRLPWRGKSRPWRMGKSSPTRGRRARACSSCASSGRCSASPRSRATRSSARSLSQPPTRVRCSRCSGGFSSRARRRAPRARAGTTRCAASWRSASCSSSPPFCSASSTPRTPSSSLASACSYCSRCATRRRPSATPANFRTSTTRWTRWCARAAPARPLRAPRAPLHRASSCRRRLSSRPLAPARPPARPRAAHGSDRHGRQQARLLLVWG